MIQLSATPKQFLRKSLLIATVFCVVMLGVFSPVFSYNVRAKIWTCPILPNTQKVGYACYSSESVCKESKGACIGACIEREDSFGTTDCLGGSVKEKPLASTDVEAPSGPDLIGGFVVGVVVRTLVEILEAVNFMLTILVAWFAQLFDGIVAISLAGLSGIDAVTRGWTITRDIANIFFIFALLVIAIATILRLESYGAKQLLPKLIIVALLINFSLVIAFTVVDASNILALAFINEIGTPTVSNSIATVLQLGKITDTTPINGKHVNITPKNSLSAGMETTIKTQLNQEFTNDPAILTPTPTLPNRSSETIIQFFWQATILILQLTLIFVFVALSVMLLIRSVALIMLFVLAPLGFLAAILPATRTYSSKWWHKLFEWSFFFPASAFMIYLAIAFGAQMVQALSGGGGNQVINTGVLFSYFATVAFLMGSLVVAKQMGIVGAAAAIGIGVGMAKAVRGYAGRVSGKAALRYGVGPAGAGVGFFPQQLGRIPYVGAPFRLIAKPFAAMQRSGARTREGQYEDIKKRVSESKSANLATRRTLTAPGAIRAFDEAVIDKGQAQIIPEKALRQHVQRFKQEKEFTKLRKIYAYDPTLAAEGEATPEATASAVSQAAQGLSVDDIRTKTNAETISNALFADAVLLNYGSQKLEASVETFGVRLAPALHEAFERLREKNLDKMLVGTGRTRATAMPDENRKAYDDTIKQMNKENPDLLKFVARNQTMNMAPPPGPGMLNISETIRIAVQTMNDNAETEEEGAFEDNEKRRAVQALRARLRTRIPTPAEIATEEANAVAAITARERENAKKRAKKIEI